MPLLFIAIPLIELYFILVVGDIIGAFWTVILVILTAVIGVNMLRVQGMSTLMRAQKNMAHGQIPAMEMMEGLALAVAGVLLITPGFITDSIGMLCLIPASRQAIIRYIMARSSVKTNFYGGAGNQSAQWQPDRQQQSHHQQGDYQQGHRPDEPGSTPPKVGRTIEGEYKRED